MIGAFGPLLDCLHVLGVQGNSGAADKLFARSSINQSGPWRNDGKKMALLTVL
jgi:hypothetical protein